MLLHVKSTSSGIQVINSNMGQVEVVIGNTSDHFDKLVKDFDENAGQLSRIAAAIEEVSVTNDEIHRQVKDIHGLSKNVAGLLAESDKSIGDMTKITEGMLRAVTQFRIGNDVMEDVMEKARMYRDKIQAKIQEIAGHGVNVFDHAYKPVPNTDPQKYTSSYDAAFRQELQSLVDEARRDLKVVYCMTADINGYFAIHHQEVSKPMTGNPKTDLVYSRQQKLYFTSDTEKRRSTSTEPFLLQTYIRDTGAILNDLSMPIFINNKHWGALVMGILPERLHTEPAAAPALP
jgi:methyl-accepting chemotaxis protein